MKSTLKITSDSQGNLTKPVIKIVQPVEVIDPTDYERHVGTDDDRDTLIRHLLQSPMNPWLNDWFEVHTRFPIEQGTVISHYITTIAAVDENDLFLRFKNSIINRMIPKEDMIKINSNEVPEDKSQLPGTRKTERLDYSIIKLKKIVEFFDWLEENDKASFEEQELIQTQSY